MTQDLLRQRRNLIAISAVLLIFDFASVRVGKVSLLGTELLIGNAQVLMVCAWVLWAYFLLRYYQYWRAEKDQHIRSSFEQRIDHYARSYTKAKAVRGPSGDVYDSYKITRTGLASWAHTLQDYSPAQGMVIDRLTVPLPLWRLATWWLRSAAYVCLQTPHATDHLLPFALAIAAPVVTIFTKAQPFLIELLGGKPT